MVIQQPVSAPVAWSQSLLGLLLVSSPTAGPGSFSSGARAGVPYALASAVVGLSFGVLARPVMGPVAAIVTYSSATKTASMRRAIRDLGTGPNQILSSPILDQIGTGPRELFGRTPHPEELQRIFGERQPQAFRLGHQLCLKFLR